MNERIVPEAGTVEYKRRVPAAALEDHSYAAVAFPLSEYGLIGMESWCAVGAEAAAEGMVEHLEDAGVPS